MDVYFDDVKITHTKTPVLQYNEYYPFGLQTANSWTRENTTNGFLYNAGTELNATSGYYETPFRSYDAALGRFMQVDALAPSYGSQTPYNYANNDPVYFSDPTGLYGQGDCSWCSPVPSRSGNGEIMDPISRQPQIGSLFDGYTGGSFTGGWGEGYGSAGLSDGGFADANRFFTRQRGKAFLQEINDLVGSLPDGIIPILDPVSIEEARLGGDFLQVRIDAFLVSQQPLSSHQRTMNNPLVRAQHKAQREFASNPFGGAILGLVTGGGLVGGGGRKLAGLGLKRILALRSSPFAKELLKNTLFELSSQLIINKGDPITSLTKMDLFDVATGARFSKYKSLAFLAGAVDFSYQDGLTFIGGSGDFYKNPLSGLSDGLIQFGIGGVSNTRPLLQEATLEIFGGAVSTKISDSWGN